MFPSIFFPSLDIFIENALFRTLNLERVNAETPTHNRYMSIVVQ